jgi:hypothetical protein
MGTEAVIIFDLQATGHAQPDGTLICRPDTVTPMVMVGIAAARPAQQRGWHCPQGFENIDPEAVLLWNTGPM